jgi:hypothetical protein
MEILVPGGSGIFGRAKVDQTPNEQQVLNHCVRRMRNILGKEKSILPELLCLRTLQQSIDSLQSLSHV